MTLVADRLQGVDCPLCETNEEHTHVLPCPFCGGTDLRVRLVYIGRYIVCTTCNAFGPDVMGDDAVKGWNRRAK